MDEIMEEKDVLLGNEKYKYLKTRDGQETLNTVQNIGKQQIDVVLRATGQSNSKDIEKYIIDVLSDLYIKRNLEKLI